MPPRLFNLLWYIAAIVAAICLGLYLPRNPLTLPVVILPLCVIPFLLFTMESLLGVIVVMCAAYAGTIGLLNSFPSGLPGLQIHDVLTIALTGLSGFMVLTVGQRVRARWLWSDLLYILFVAWAAIRVHNAPVVFDAVKDLLFFALFWVICMVSRLYVSERRGRAVRVTYSLFAGAVVSFVLLLLFASIGMAGWTSTGLMSPLGRRPLALFLMVVFSAALSAWLFPVTPRTKRWGIVFTLLTGGLVVLTFSRTVILIMVVVHVPAALLLRNAQRLASVRSVVKIPLYVAVVVTAALLSMKFHIVQDRFFFQANTVRVEDLLYWRNLNTMGRTYVWPEIWRHAKTAPWIGHGTGSARSYANMICGWEHPHCDYLRVFHDQGGLGFLLFVGFWLAKTVHLWKLHRWSTSQAARQATFGALVAEMGILVSFVTDNSMVYTYAMLPVALLIGAGEAAYEKSRVESDSADQKRLLSSPYPVEGDDVVALAE